MPLPLLSLALSCAPALPQDYTIEAFGSLSATPSDATRAASINNRGHVHGEGNKTSLSGAGLQWRGFLWDGLVMKEILPPVSGSTWSGGLNDDDQCVGYLTAGGVKLDGYVWDDGLLDPVALGTHNYTRSRDINVHGISAGIYTSDVVWSFVYQYRAFLRNGAGTWIDLGAFGDRETHAHALNDWNQATGYSRTNTGQHLGFLWTWSGGLSDLGSLGGTFCDPEDIDNFTRIVGASADAAGVLRPFLWQGGTMVDLGTLGGPAGRAKGVNDFGVIVGNAQDASGAQRAVLWENGNIVDLNTRIPPGTSWDLTGAHEINELGEITGTGRLDGDQRAYKLTPILTAPRLSGFQPGIGGLQSTLFGMGFTPGSTVQLFFGLAAGSTPLPCGSQLDILSLGSFATTSADALGRIEVELVLPPLVGGLVPLFQALDVASCTPSEVRDQLLQ